MKPKLKPNELAGCSELPLTRDSGHRSKSERRLLDTTAAVEHRKRSADEKFLTITKVAELLVISDRTVRRWIKFKKLKWHRFGGATRVASGDLIAFAERARRRGVPKRTRDALEDTFYTVKGVAEILNVCVRTVRRRIDASALGAHDFFGIIRVADSDLRDFIDRSVRD
jgi:excisionase family DNA binding protein